MDSCRLFSGECGKRAVFAVTRRLHNARRIPLRCIKFPTLIACGLGAAVNKLDCSFDKAIDLKTADERRSRRFAGTLPQFA